MADQLDKRIQIHLHESAGEIDNSLKATGMRPIERLRELGLINASLMAVHAVHLTDDEIALFADPVWSSRIAPFESEARGRYRQNSGFAGGRHHVGLGTDSAASNNVIEMPGEMRTAALLAKVRADDAAALPASAALKMATLEWREDTGPGCRNWLARSR